MDLQYFAWTGSTLLSFCAFPQVVRCCLQGHAHGISWTFLLMWLIGEIFLLIYMLPKGDIPLIANYLLNIVFLAIIIRYKVKPRRPND